MYKIKNNYNQYIFKTATVVSFTSEENATVFKEKAFAEDICSRLNLFYAAGKQFKTEEL